MYRAMSLMIFLSYLLFFSLYSMEGLDDLPDSKIVELYPQNLPRRDLAKILELLALLKNEKDVQTDNSTVKVREGYR